MFKLRNKFLVGIVDVNCLTSRSEISQLYGYVAIVTAFIWLCRHCHCVHMDNTPLSLRSYGYVNIVIAFIWNCHNCYCVHMDMSPLTLRSFGYGTIVIAFVWICHFCHCVHMCYIHNLFYTCIFFVLSNP